ncbi:YrvL family regulatory protein [Planococcus sp. CAU13]|uniref:YrvL family regulatory protein n=1 Tax=Planococcus sp. CAU13 TaxID=1541197 RepID=UPI00068FD24A|nr:YrvL family regulatory protein [Planococcus sp. CAU13]
MENDKSFKEESPKDKVFIILVMTLLVGGSLAFVFGIYFFGIAGLFNILGVQYDSVWSLFWFGVFFFILDSFADVIKMTFTVLLDHLSIANAATLFAINFLVIWAVLSLLNLLMDSITISIDAQLIAAAVIALIELTLNKNGRKEEQLE